MGPRVAGTSAPPRAPPRSPRSRPAAAPTRLDECEFAGGRACFTEIRSNCRSDRPREFPLEVLLLRGNQSTKQCEGARLSSGSSGAIKPQQAGTARFLRRRHAGRVCRHCCTAAARSPARSRAGREELELGLRAPPRRGVGRPENGPPVARPTAGVASGWTYATVLLPRYAN